VTPADQQQVVALIREAEKRQRENVRKVIVALKAEAASKWDIAPLRAMLAILDKLDESQLERSET
jgi:hypothetical protein